MNYPKQLQTLQPILRQAQDDGLGQCRSKGKKKYQEAFANTLEHNQHTCVILSLPSNVTLYPVMLTLAALNRSC